MTYEPKQAVHLPIDDYLQLEQLVLVAGHRHPDLSIPLQ